jgi:hypothetical protein
MSIFGILELSFLLACLICFICIAGYTASDNEGWITAAIICFLAVILVAPIIGVGINTTNERVYIQKYTAQKETIEASLESETLTGLERVELVTKAVDLNGEFAERKAKFDIWHHVYFDNSIYDGMEPIDLNKGVVEND